MYCCKIVIFSQSGNFFILSQLNDGPSRGITSTTVLSGTCVQTQVNVSKLGLGLGITIKKMTVDCAFFKTIMKKVHDFFSCGMLPEVVGKWYMRRPVADCNSVVPISCTN